MMKNKRKFKLLQVDLLGKDKESFCDAMNRIFHCRKEDKGECYVCWFDAAAQVQKYCNLTGKSIAKGIERWSISSIPKDVTAKMIQEFLEKTNE